MSRQLHVHPDAAARMSMQAKLNAASGNGREPRDNSPSRNNVADARRSAPVARKSSERVAVQLDS